MIRVLPERERDKGSALVEFGLAAATVLLVLFLIVDVGRALYAYNWISNAARQGTRFAMVRGKTCDPLLATYCQTNSMPRGAQSSDITNYVDSLAVGIDTTPGVLTVISHCYVSGTPAPDPPCTAQTWVQVQVLYNFHFLSPLFPLSWTMQSTSERVVQQ
jgi:Flp pilus assembly protein TadG